MSSSLRALRLAATSRVQFGASPAGEPLIEAIDYLKTLDGDKKKATAKPPLDIVDAAWRGYVVCDGKVDLQAYTFCFLDRLRKGLRRRDVFVTTSVRYADPRIGLLEGEAWEGTRPFICRSLGLPASANEAFSVLRHRNRGPQKRWLRRGVGIHETQPLLLVHISKNFLRRMGTLT